MFRCEAVFFAHHLSSLSAIKPSYLGKYLNKFYIVEPLPMVTLADYATVNDVTPEFLAKNLPNLLNTLSSLHSAKFPYLSLSPFSIIVDDAFWLRPPSICPYSAPKSLFPPPPKSHRSYFRSANEQRFYRPPEWNAVPPFIQSDCWSLAAVLSEILITKGPIFGSLSVIDQMNRTQMILGAAPGYLNWTPPPPVESMNLPNILKQMFDYDPRKRPSLCPHFASILLDFIQSCQSNVPGGKEGFGPMLDSSSSYKQRMNGQSPRENKPPFSDSRKRPEQGGKQPSNEYDHENVHYDSDMKAVGANHAGRIEQGTNQGYKQEGMYPRHGYSEQGSRRQTYEFEQGRKQPTNGFEQENKRQAYEFEQGRKQPTNGFEQENKHQAYEFEQGRKQPTNGFEQENKRQTYEFEQSPEGNGFYSEGNKPPRTPKRTGDSIRRPIEKPKTGENVNVDMKQPGTSFKYQEKSESSDQKSINTSDIRKTSSDYSYYSSSGRRTSSGSPRSSQTETTTTSDSTKGKSSLQSSQPSSYQSSQLTESVLEEEQPSSVFPESSLGGGSSPIPPPNKSSHRESSQSYYSTSQSMMSSQEYEDLKMRIERIEKAIEATKLPQQQANSSVEESGLDNSTDELEEAVKEIATLKQRLYACDQKLLTGCSGCIVGEMVDKGLQKEAMILEQTLDDLNSP